MTMLKPISRFLITILVVSYATVVNAQAGQDGITVAIGSDITTVDPHLTTDTDSASVRYHIYEGLVHTDGSGQVEPQLAESWTISDNEMEYTFSLREGVKFHDGTDFSAEAVKLNFDRVIDPERESSVKDYMSMIAETEVIDEYTVAITLKEPFGPFLNHLGVHAGLILSPRAAAEHGLNDVGDDAAGTGPYRFVERARGERIVLERFDDYWGAAPDIARIVYQVVPEAGSRVAMLETGEADFILRVTPDVIETVEASPDLDVVTIQTARTMYLVLNVQNPPFDDVRIRHAANYAVDKEAIIEFLLNGDTRPADAPIAPAINGYSPIGYYEYNPERALQLLAESGNENPRITMWGPEARFPQGVEVVQVVQQQLQEVGFEVDLQVWGDYPAYLGTFRSQMSEQDAALMGWAASTLDAEAALRQPLHGERAGLFINTGGYANPDVDRLLDLARASADPDVRRDLYRQANEIIMEDAPWLFLYYGTVSYGQQVGLTGVDYRASEHVLFLDAELERD